MADLVTHNVGGTLYSTTVKTLTRYPKSMLGSMFGACIPPNRDSDGHYIIDGDGPIFRHVLNFLRRSSLCLPQDFQEWDLLSAEADFFQIQELIDAVKALKEKRSGEGSRQEMEFIEICFYTNYMGVMRYSGTVATLKDIPTLREGYKEGSYMHKNATDSELVDVEGKYTDEHHEMNRMKIMGEITRLGFRLFNTFTREDPQGKQMQAIVFWRNIK